MSTIDAVDRSALPGCERGVELPEPRYSSRDLTRVILSVGAIGGLIVSTAWIVRPFVSAFLWATVIVISTWPLLLGLQARLWGKRGLATTVMTLALLLVLLVPLGISVGALVGNIDRIVAWVTSLDKLVLPPPPAWLAGIPLAGDKIVAAWNHLASQGPDGVTARAVPYARAFIRWFATQIGGAGAMILQFLMTVIMCGVLYAKGEAAARGIRKFATRLAGSNGDRAALLAASTIRGVAIGIVVTALVQVLIAGTGLVILSVPGALLLSAVIFFLCLAQLGPALIMLPAVGWQFYTGSTLSGCVLLAFALVSMTIDNILRPILIRKGADLSLPLIFTGVIGGMIAMGIMGIFLGPVILAVTYNQLKEWVENRSEPDEDAATGVAVEPTTAAG
jgi:predicted PurR-regulated permease PerM